MLKRINEPVIVYDVIKFIKASPQFDGDIILHAPRVLTCQRNHTEYRIRIFPVEYHELKNLAAVLAHIGNGLIFQVPKDSQDRLP